MDALKLRATLGLDTSEYKSGLDDAEKTADKKGTSIGGKFDGLAKGIGMAFTATVAAVGAAATAVGVLGKQSIEAYADYEQLVGGVETLFGAGGKSLEEYAGGVEKVTDSIKKEYDSMVAAQDTVLQNASNAYKTAGLSANEYMDTVTSFSAALIASLDGDTQAAANKADLAITDMADNANKMGSSVEQIQTAYQGFAKQNYTMLDNLKLGYGGTKTEMERLLADAQKISGIKYDISSYADIVDAIHVVQTEMGITGTTAKEASTTISGSINSMKSAWANLVTGLADDNADMKGLIDNLLETILGSVDETGNRVGGVINNIIPRISQALSGIGDMIKGLAPIISEQLPVLFEQMLPILINSATTLLNTILGIIPDLLKTVIAQLPTVLASLKEVITTIVNILTENLPELIKTGIEVISSLVEGISEAIPDLIPAIVNAVLTIVETLIDNIDMLIDAAITLMTALATGLIDALPVLIDKIPTIVIKIVNALIKNAPKLLQAAIKLVTTLATGLIKNIPTLIKAVGNLIVDIVNAFKNTDWLSIGVNIIEGVISGVSSMGKAFLDAITDLAKSAFDGIKNFFGIHSPSKKMRDQIGKNIVKGMIDGVNAEKKNAKKSAEELGALYVSAAKTRVDALKAENKLSLEEEWAYWLEVRDATVQGTKAYDEATKKISEVRKAVKENQKDLKALGTTYIDSVKKVTDDLDAQITKLNEAYKNAVESRKNEILNMFGLFSEAKLDEGIESWTLTQNLEGQVKALEEWSNTLYDLESKIGGTALYNELEKMGASSLETLKNINQMSDEELERYIELYDKKNQIAQERAVSENEDLKSKTDEQIEKLKTNAEKQIKSLTKEYKKGIKKLGRDANKAFNSAGVSAIQGMGEGMETEFKQLEKQMKKRAKQLVKAVQEELDIHSPSKVFAEEVGKFIPLGIAEGIDKNSDAVTSSIGKALDYSYDPVVGAMGIDTKTTATSNDNIYNLLREMLPSLANQKIILDTGILVGETAPKMDKALGAISSKNARMVTVW